MYVKKHEIPVPRISFFFMHCALDNGLLVVISFRWLSFRHDINRRHQSMNLTTRPNLRTIIDIFRLWVTFLDLTK